MLNANIEREVGNDEYEDGGAGESSQIYVMSV
jgi:hypothetical protein